MRLSPVFWQRDGTTGAVMPGRPKDYAVRSMSWNVIGGPDQSEISVPATYDTIMRLFDTLGYRVHLLDDRGQPQWWGFINEVRFSVDEIEVGVSLDGMGNRVFVVYSTPANANGTTSAVEHARSQAIYGVKEKRMSLANVSTTVAAQRAQIILNQIAYMVRTPLSALGYGNKPTATLICKGPWDYLRWRYYSKADYYFIGRENTGWSGTYPAAYPNFYIWPSTPEGAPWTNPSGLSFVAIAVPFTWTGDTQTLSQIELQFAHSGGGSTRAVEVYILDYIDDPPNASPDLTYDHQVGHVTLGPKDGGTNPITYWTRAAYPISGTVVNSSSYWLVVYSPAYVGAYNQLLGHTQTAAIGGRMGFDPGWQAENGSNYPYYVPDFRLRGVKEHTAQIADVVAACDFLEGTDTIDLSGISDSPYRDGTQTQQQIISELLQAGTTNYRRLLASVTREMVLRVYEEPAEVPTLLMDSHLNFYKGNSRYYGCPVGQWVRIMNFPTPSGAVVDPAVFFCERASYDTTSGRWNPEARDTQGEFNL